MEYRIGQLAKIADVNLETIRYYERQGLMKQPQKPGVGYRMYGKEYLQRLQFIIRAKHLGFTLAEIKNLLVLSDGSCSDVQDLAKQKLQSIHTKIKDLHRLETSLQHLVKECEISPDENHCPIIESLVNEK